MPRPQRIGYPLADSMRKDGFTPFERSLLRRLRTHEKIQQFLDELPYNKERGGETCRSPRRVIRDNTAHCFEGALLAAAALRFHGDPPLVIQLEAVRDDNHLVAVYRRGGLWGALAKSNYAGLRRREPVYRTLRELALSYFEQYYNLEGEKSLRAYSRPVNLKRFDRMDWMTAEDDLWEISNYLQGVPSIRLFPPAVDRRLCRTDARLFAAGKVGMAE